MVDIQAPQANEKKMLLVSKNKTMYVYIFIYAYIYTYTHTGTDIYILVKQKGSFLSSSLTGINRKV